MNQLFLSFVLFFVVTSCATTKPAETKPNQNSPVKTSTSSSKKHPAEIEGSYESLAKSPHFTIGLIGFAAQNTAQNQSIERLIEYAKQDPVIFDELLKEDSSVAKLYGLYGWARLQISSKDFEQKAAPLLLQNPSVFTMLGCSMGPMSVKAIIDGFPKTSDTKK